MIKQEKYEWLTEQARAFLANGYIQNQTAEERYSDIADRFEELTKIEGFADKWRYYFSKGWTTLSSPIISNLGKDTGLPASCNFLSIQDTIQSITSSEYEMSMLAANGAGTARNFSNIRPKGAKYGVNGKSEGVMSWIESHAQKIYKISQGGVRRGFLTAYLKVTHGEIHDFLTIGREGSNIKRITTGVTIPEGWIDDMLSTGDAEKWDIWTKIHESRAEIGRPYLLFEDNANKGKHQVYLDNGIMLDTSNICTECLELTDEEKEFLCVLLSVNATKVDEWRGTDFIFDCNLALDAVVTEYIEKASKIPGHTKAVKFAQEHRSIGIGVMGFHTLLQQKSIVFGSLESHMMNVQLFKYIRSESDRASKWMAKEWGEAPYAKGYGDRNTSRIAIAPTKSTSSIAGDISEGINAIDANYNTKDLAKSQTEWKNPELAKVLESYGKNSSDIWLSILENGGSAQHLDFLSQHERDVFKIATEISQLDVIKLAASRQRYIDQAQSVNLTIPKNASAYDVMALTLEAWKEGLKTLYYQHNVNSAQEFSKNILTCSSCEA